MRLESLYSPSTPSIHRSQPTTSRSPPEPHWYKINFDGAIFAEDNTVGLGVVIKNNEGLAMASLSLQIPLSSMVINVEVLSMRSALDLALEIGFDHMVLDDLEILFKVSRIVVET